MSLYSQRLNILTKELKILKDRQKKRLKVNQQIMYNFITGVTKKAIFEIESKGITVSLQKGDSKKGFVHILEKYYCKDCPGEITTKDILNFSNIIESGIKLGSEGVTNKELIVFYHSKGIKKHKVVLKPLLNNNFVVTIYSIE